MSMSHSSSAARFTAARVAHFEHRKLTDCQCGRLSWSNFEWPEFRESSHS